MADGKFSFCDDDGLQTILIIDAVHLASTWIYLRKENMDDATQHSVVFEETIRQNITYSF